MFTQYPHSLAFLRSLLSRHRKRGVVFFVKIVFGALFSLLLPYIAKIETDQLVAQSPELRGFVTSSFGIFVVILMVGFVVEMMKELTSTVLAYMQGSLEQNFETDYFVALYSRLKYIELGIYANPKNQDLFAKILGETRIVKEMLNQMGEIASLVIFMGGSIGLISLLSWKIAVGLCVGGVAYYLMYLRERKVNTWKRFDTRELERGMRSMRYMAESSYHKLVAIGANQLVLSTIHEYEVTNKSIQQSYKKKQDTIGLMRMVVDVMIRYGIKVIVGWSIFQATASIGSLAMSIALLTTLSGYISNLVRTKEFADENKEKFAMLELYLEATTTKSGLEERLTDISFDAIRIRDLTFAYPNFTEYELKYFDIMLEKLSLDEHRNEEDLNTLHALQEAKKESKQPLVNVLHALTCEFEKGKVYGVVGKNGAGKTTLMHLIMGYFSSYTGQMDWGTTSQRSLTFDHFEKNICVIEQEPFLLRGFTIKQNILVGVERDVPDEEIYRLLGLFGMEKMVRDFRKGLDTLYSYNCNLSGGQKQIVSLLRVYLQDKPVMILDEGTNQLDAENEALIMKMLLENKKEKIIIMISHRMTTLQKADYLYCLEKGRITDQGSPDELRSRDSLFLKFWEEQVG